MPTFEIGEQDFLLDGRPHQVLSGALHYFRVHPDLWADRIRSARQMGLNTIETYVAWNVHAPTPDVFDTSGPRDLGRFLDLVAAEGMHAIVRPGPYICAEWDNGGFPAWLFRLPGVGVRRNEPTYLAAVEQYLAHVLPLVAARQVTRGGPVIAVQVENEYGAYGDDQEYLRALVAMTRAQGIEVPLLTCDQADDAMLERGGLPGVHRTATFGSRTAERLEVLRRHQPTGPLMCMEFWCGWFDHWGAHHHTTDAAASAADLDALLAAGGSVNVYMFHGGTNTGFTSGANDKGVYQPTVTSYDYDAPLAEDGTRTAKYDAFREVLGRYTALPDDVPPVRAPAPTAVLRDGRRTVDLWSVVDGLDGWVEAPDVPTYEQVGAVGGFVLHRATVDLTAPAVLAFGEVRDRAQVFLDGRPVGVLDRAEHATALTLPAVGVARLDVLVEDQGRVNYGPRIGEDKGLIGPATLGGRPLTGWRVLPVDVDAVAASPALAAGAAPATGPVPGPSFSVWEHDLPVADLFVSTRGWGKGVVWVNGTSLGRYWSKGPQTTLYAPAPTVTGRGDRVVVLELLAGAGQLALVDAPDLGHTDS
ncbi:beta-galactosidase [Cellulomonas sp. zg-ZUI199]|uniref:Beta-galactosidase n=1 Tax=Cellulomonas wangleii TaxID=2816956 RepID=A0ABX8D8S7_9CELL|nr:MULTISPECIES: beta-galactosidase family protein [Cellulomonas]MBO0898861.1 beta-galactosidase [Cellulomonas sp. zg-ZUI22]MBO0923850.1 beta-galactosidase [Cellulomonas wangleii]MBO0924132.1 beta-galactosidase [Cellulomonas wangleii]QVI62157.1 beta-galactosidase [Cellulomonas wangleii]